MKAELAWQSAQGQLQLEMPKAAYDTWVRDAETVTFEDGTFIIGVHNAYARDWLESRLSTTIVRILTGIMNRSVEVRFTVWHAVDTSDAVDSLAVANSLTDEMDRLSNQSLKP